MSTSEKNARGSPSHLRGVGKGGGGVGGSHFL